MIEHGRDQFLGFLFGRPDGATLTQKDDPSEGRVCIQPCNGSRVNTSPPGVTQHRSRDIHLLLAAAKRSGDHAAAFSVSPQAELKTPRFAVIPSHRR